MPRMAERYKSPRELPTRIPLFPLRGTILLPRAVLPLNIFEPRYLAMFDDAMSGERLIGMVQTGPAAGTEDSPVGSQVPIRRVGCVGRITSYQELDDGRLLIALTGIARFEVAAEAPSVKPYRIATVEYARYAGDFTPGAGEDEVDREALMRSLKGYIEAHKLRADWKSIARTGNEQLVNALSVICPYGAEEKQALLEAPTLKGRAEALVALAEMAVAARTDGSGSAVQ